ncbi:MAG: methyltransferase domain-containing protein [Candidatus Lokiarchaeota archaeon]|nr:methyltransferase domain-containing protein [Candidatus Lokiarchaeota archaeon]
MWFDFLLAHHLIPDLFVRIGLWLHFLRRRLHDPINVEKRSKYMNEYLKIMKNQPIALSTERANEQHYEVPTEFFKIVLGARKKYSCCWYPKANLNYLFNKRRLVRDLDNAESKMFEITAKRALIKNGESILDLGCGWGSFTLYVAEKFPDCSITAISNSKTQKKYIEGIAKSMRYQNIKVITANISDFSVDEFLKRNDRKEKFDRIISIEMFEHMRNYEMLMAKLSKILKPNGTLFIHIFARSGLPYLMSVKKTSGFISKYFFTGGMMPSEDLILYFQEHFKIAQKWHINGLHYYRTLMAWLKKLRMNRKAIKRIFDRAYGEGSGTKWYNYWKIFFISCGEMFRHAFGNRWFVVHYLLKKIK